MKLMFIGDVVSKQGCEFLAKHIFDLKKEYEAVSFSRDSTVSCVSINRKSAVAVKRRLILFD